MILISPSILASDFANLEREVCAIAKGGADLVHVDVMDGHFVPNITIGVPVVQALKRISPIPLDVHLMISDPLTFVPAFANAGSDIITFHLECECDVQKTIDTIRQNGAKVGVSLKPNTAAEAVFPFLNQVDMVLVMTVEPGFGGQSFMSDMLPKVSAIHQRILEIGRNVDIQVDGGIDPTTAPLVAKAGANVLVAGSAVFRYENYAEPISAIRKAAEASL
ncbi:MAG: ribulose-phosphate 3-epimerase [Oscillospiraceae bacterium]|jgi:ribulose-phosphate 3-epimerase|nr:ribulose-phosphate 3-epimerase [Oscillospiraceae bacterium]